MIVGTIILINERKMIMNYQNTSIGEIERYCPVAANALLGTKIDELYANLTAETPVKYNGELLTVEQVANINNMCPASNGVSLGDIFNGLLTASKNGTSVVKITDIVATAINNIDKAYNECSMGTKIQNMADIINSMVVTPPEV